MTLVRSTRKLTKLALAGAVYYSGILDLYRRQKMKHAAIVLLYHRIVDERSDLLDYSPSGMTVTHTQFDAQMAYVADHFHVVPLADIVSRAAQGMTLDDSLCAITFDDGWRDNYTHAFPILKRRRLPATIFLATNFIDRRRWFWEERLKYLLGHFRQQLAPGGSPESAAQEMIRTIARLEMARAMTVEIAAFPGELTRLVNVLRERSPAQRETVMAELERLLDLPGLAEPRRFVSWDEVREMAAGGVDFGAHTVSHVNLERCDSTTAESELRESRDVIARELGRRPHLLAYPYGKNTPSVRELTRQAGFASALTTRSGVVRQGDDLLGLNRVDIHERAASTLPMFACRALQLLNAY